MWYLILLLIGSPLVCGAEECGPNEEFYGCVPTCNNTCENVNQKNVMCPMYCREGCDCMKGLVRRSDGTCVPPKKCGTTTDSCGENETYMTCGTACPETCSNLGKPQMCTKQCVSGCFCSSGLVRNEFNKCVKPSQCSTGSSTECGLNEQYYDCVPTCKNTCENYNAKNPICSRLCRKGCACRNGYVKRNDGKCVKPQQCSKALCPRNEVPTNCENPCNTCDVRGSCQFLVCNKGCNCIKGYVRNENGACMPASRCPKNCGLNEEYKECGTACPKTCKNKDVMIACIDLCVKGCFCKDGFVKNDDGVCVNPEECPQKNCPENETYNNCGSACQETCKNTGKPRICTKQCVSGCFCNKGLVRNDKGICIKPQKCKTQECPENESYNECGDNCAATCDQPQRPLYCKIRCGPGCFCNDGFIRNNNGICVLPEQCSSTNVCGSNEEYKKCGTACPRTCKNKDAMIKCTSQCVEGCFCLEGMVRDDDGQCVYPEECSTDSSESSEES